MNTNENFENKTNIEYVNPLNPNEVLKSKNSFNIEKHDEVVDKVVDEVKKIDDIKVEEDVKTEQTDNTKETTITINKHRGKNKLVIVIVVLIALAIILASILLIPKIFNNDKKPIVDNQTQNETTINLSNIVNNATNNTYYKFLTSTYTTNISTIDNSIIFDLNAIDQTNPINKQIIFNLTDRNLTITLNPSEDNTDNLYAIYAILDSIGQYYGHEVDEVGNYLSSIQNNYNFNTIGITTVELTTDVLDPTTGVTTPITTGQIQISINIDTNFSTTGLELMYFSLDDLNIYKDSIINYTTNLKKGDLVLYTNNSTTYTILIGQRKQLNDNTYNSITSIIELLYPEEINDFKSKFTSLSTISFDKYKITIDPILDSNTFSQYQSNYKFILVEIIKQA